MKHWTWASASVRGTAHIRSGTRRQDAYYCAAVGTLPERLVCIASDGAGSAKFGGEGATLVCRTVSVFARKHLREFGQLPSQDSVMSWLDEVRDRIAYAAEKRGCTPRDFAATAIVVLSDATQTMIAQVGDGCAAIRGLGTNEWDIPIWPAHGEYASTTNFVTDDPEVQCQCVLVPNGISALAVMTDGLERLALDLSAKKAFPGFFNKMIQPVVTSPSRGKDSQLSISLMDYLGGNDVCARTDDDKTLIVAALK